MPPLRSSATATRCAPASADGTIDAICSDHTPVDDDAKQLPFARSRARRDRPRAAAAAGAQVGPRRRGALVPCAARRSRRLAGFDHRHCACIAAQAATPPTSASSIRRRVDGASARCAARARTRLSLASRCRGKYVMSSSRVDWSMCPRPRQRQQRHRPLPRRPQQRRRQPQRAQLEGDEFERPPDQPLPGAEPRRAAARTSARASSKCRRRPASSRTCSSTLAHRPDEFRAFFAYHDALMLKDGRPEQGRARDDRRRDVAARTTASTASSRTARSCASTRRSRWSPTRSRSTTARPTSRRASARCSTSRSRSRATSHAIERRRLRRAARARLLRRGHLGHRRDRRVLRAVEPHGEHDLDAAQRRVLPDGPRAAHVLVNPDCSGSTRRDDVGCVARGRPARRGLNRGSASARRRNVAGGDICAAAAEEVALHLALRDTSLALGVSEVQSIFVDQHGLLASSTVWPRFLRRRSRRCACRARPDRKAKSRPSASRPSLKPGPTVRAMADTFSATGGS